ncbi:MAG: hypothetical protein ACLTWO_12060 [Blautia massiliensis (ex Durand et al. 2017)]
MGKTHRNIFVWNFFGPFFVKKGQPNPSGRCTALAGLRLAHHAARLGAALAFCDRCPCFVSLYPPQAALDSAAPEGEPLTGTLTGSRVKASTRRGGVCRRQTEGWEPSCNPAPCGQQKTRRGLDPAGFSIVPQITYFFLLYLRSFLIRKEPKEFYPKRHGCTPMPFYWNFFGPFFVKKGHLPSPSPKTAKK